MSDSTAEAITAAFAQEDDTNVVDALMSMSRALRDLGNGNAATSLGGLEAHGMTMLEGANNIAGALAGVAEAINRLAEAVENQ